MNKFPDKIVILGVGLIGGSIALGLKSHFGARITISGSCSNLSRAQKAKTDGIIDIALDKNNPIPKGTGLIIIATPIKTILEILKRFSKGFPTNCLIIDVGSTKKVISETAEKSLQGKIQFIGTHPMAGSEMSGFENASVNLFRNKPWIICPPEKVNQDHLAIVKKLVILLGGKPSVMNVEEHDRLTTWASHIFLAASSMMVNAIAKQKSLNAVLRIASSGFRDTTRLASDNSQMKTDIFLTNKVNMLTVLDHLKQEIDYFARLITDSDKKNLLDYFTRAKRIRDHWLSVYFS